MRRMISVCTLLAAAIGAPAAAQAQTDAGFNRKCYGAGSPDMTIEACTGLITGGFLNRKDPRAAVKARGNAYDDKGEFDSAIDDYGHAVAVNPSDGGVFNDRGAAYSAKG